MINDVTQQEPAASSPPRCGIVVTRMSTVRQTATGRATDQLGLGSRAAVPAVVLRWDCESRVVGSGPLTVKYR